VQPFENVHDTEHHSSLSSDSFLSLFFL